MDKAQKKKTASIAIITAMSLLILFALVGTKILSIFAINIYSFMIAGGILLFILAIELLTHGTLRYNKEDSRRYRSCPLGISSSSWPWCNDHGHYII